MEPIFVIPTGGKYHQATLKKPSEFLSDLEISVQSPRVETFLRQQSGDPFRGSYTSPFVRGKISIPSFVYSIEKDTPLLLTKHFNMDSNCPSSLELYDGRIPLGEKGLYLIGEKARTDSTRIESMIQELLESRNIRKETAAPEDFFAKHTDPSYIERAAEVVSALTYHLRVQECLEGSSQIAKDWGADAYSLVFIHHDKPRVLRLSPYMQLYTQK